MRFIFAFFLYLLLIPNHAIACSCSGERYTENSSLENILTADLVITAAFIDIYENIAELKEKPLNILQGNSIYQQLDLEMVHTYKGSKEQKIIRVYLDTTTSCGWPYQNIEELRQYFEAEKVLIISKKDGVFYLPTACGGNYVSDKHREEILSGQFDFSKKLEHKVSSSDAEEYFHPEEFEKAKSVAELNLKIDVAKKRNDATYKFQIQRLKFKHNIFLMVLETHSYIEEDLKFYREVWNEPMLGANAGQVHHTMAYLFLLEGVDSIFHIDTISTENEITIDPNSEGYLVFKNKQNLKVMKAYTITDLLGKACSKSTTENRPASCQ